MTGIHTPALLGLGANLGHPVRQIEAALDMLAQHPDIQLLDIAGWYQTEPIGYANQPWFINTLAVISTSLSPNNLLSVCLDIERQLGRIRNPELKNGPRFIDIDLLLYDQQQITSPTLTLPHPRMHQRAFVLKPLADLMSESHLSFLAAWVTEQLPDALDVLRQALNLSDAQVWRFEPDDSSQSSPGKPRIVQPRSQLPW